MTSEARCTWLIDATGRGSLLARRLGAVRRRDDRLVAFIANFHPAAGANPDVDARTWIEAVTDGWWYTVRVPSGERVVAFLTDVDLADRAELLTLEGFTARLGQLPIAVSGRGWIEHRARQLA